MKRRKGSNATEEERSKLEKVRRKGRTKRVGGRIQGRPSLHHPNFLGS